MGEVARQTIREKSAEEEFQKRLATPITVEEARRELAGIEMQEAQLGLLRAQALGQLNQIDQRIEAARCARAEIGMRLTVKPDQEASE
jgi:hypothetical protein